MKVRPFTAAVAVLATAALLAACSQVVDGSGSPAGSGVPSGSGSVDFPSASGAGPTLSPPIETSTPPPSTPSSGPSGSGSTAGQDLSCPSIRYPYAHLAFDCITSAMVVETDDDVWPVREYDTVESGSGWSMDTGAGHWGERAGRSLGEITVNVRKQMVNQPSYGTKPTITTTSSKDTTVAGVPAHVLETTFTLNPSFAKTRHTKVKVEKSWIIALEVGTDDVSLWYVSIPDLAKSHWADVADAIASIKVI